MPNWTRNEITITGPKEVLDKLTADAVLNEKGEYEMSSWFPIPETYHKYDTTNHPNGERLVVGEEFHDGLGNSGIATEELIEEYKQATKEQREKYGAVGWYDYNCKYFGCKWDMNFETFERISDTAISINVETPWSAPAVFFMRLTKRYPEIELTVYSEYEDGPFERIVYRNGCMDLLDSGMQDWAEEDYDYDDEGEATGKNDIPW